jgi:hypothetical protein
MVIPWYCQVWVEPSPVCKARACCDVTRVILPLGWRSSSVLTLGTAFILNSCRLGVKRLDHILFMFPCRCYASAARRLCSWDRNSFFGMSSSDLVAISIERSALHVRMNVTTVVLRVIRGGLRYLKGILDVVCSSSAAPALGPRCRLSVGLCPSPLSAGDGSPRPMAFSMIWREREIGIAVSSIVWV